MDASFSGNRLSLLNRGFVYAIAHIRGGSDMGEQWYLDGKLMKKKNTFTDFIACVEKLIEDKYTTPGHLGAMGAITNMRPDLFKAVIADVPFVDVMNTILDPTLPITVGEYEEWGNPTEDKEAYEYMKSYSPYDNVTPREYPNILAIAGFNDPRVSYWESAKWVQKIRENNLGNSVVILFTNMGTGHGGASGRHDYLKEIVLDYAFLVDQLATHNH
ncbi:MAG: prolyl oligopeptidase family serine peptidase [Prevotellaceae bacterium]|nr:prolyl oligopeptidase family serine peptidase [Prevotellaceae bacterium]